MRKDSVLVLVIAGGPGAGKTSVLAELQRLYADSCVFVPEAATEIIEQLGLKPPFVGEALRLFQTLVALRQEFNERRAMERCLREGKRVIILDRARGDHPGYLPGAWPEFEELLDTTKEAELGRYHAVVFLETPSEEVYLRIFDDNKTRCESEYSVAIALSQRLRDGWADHPNFRPVRSFETWEQKREEIVGHVQWLIDEHTSRA